jgi:ATP-dependent DNA helicase DinG
VHFSSSPIRVGSLLCDAIFKPLKTVVLTSATLSVAGRSDYFDQRVGLDAVGPERFRFSQYDSPFDYTRQARLLVPIDLPEPRDPSYERRVTAVIERVLEILRGRTFVLFTSYAMLRRVRDRVSSTAERLGVRLLVQGEANRSELLERFRHGEHNMLLGTDSFWEGVDVKGRALECVVIARLPFRVPNEPLQLARVEEIEERGEPAFQAFVVPQAVLKFKQGFGRLIRSTTDRGVVLVLDPRVVTKSYGRTFLDSLPPLELLRAPTEQVLATMGEFLGANGPGPLAAAETPAQENAHDRAR